MFYSYSRASTTDMKVSSCTASSSSEYQFTFIMCRRCHGGGGNTIQVLALHRNDRGCSEVELHFILVPVFSGINLHHKLHFSFKEVVHLKRG